MQMVLQLLNGFGRACYVEVPGLEVDSRWGDAGALEDVVELLLCDGLCAVAAHGVSFLCKFFIEYS